MNINDIVICPWCKEHGLLVVPIVWPYEIAAMPFDHRYDCPYRIIGYVPCR